jgi:hypothetical protein
MGRSRHNLARLVGAVTLILLGASGCAGDHITFRFADPAARAEAQSVVVYAVRTETRSGGTVGCADLVEQRRAIGDADLLVAQQTTVLLPEARGLAPQLAQLPQAAYAFYGVAEDAFGFVVARGCAEAEVTSGRALDLAIDLATAPAPSGTLESIAATSWSQFSGFGGAEAAPALAVRARADSGQPLAGIEVRARVLSGQTQLTGSVLQTISSTNPDEDGTAATVALVEPGPVQVQLHARGLAGSPILFSIEGIANPNLREQSVVSSRSPVAIVAGNFFYDPSPDQLLPDDLLTVLDEGTASQAVIWRGGDLGWEGDTRSRDLADNVTLVAAGFFDDNQRPDLAVAIGALPLFGLARHAWLPDTLQGVRPELLPADVTAIDRLLALDADGDAFSDVVLSVRSASGRSLILFRSLGLPDTDQSHAYLEFTQRLAVPDLFEDPELYAGDLDDDGDDDLILLKSFDLAVLVPCGNDLDGSGSGRYATPAGTSVDAWPHLGLSRGTRFVAIEDFDEDGHHDALAVRDAAAGDSAHLQLARGNGTLQLHFEDIASDLRLSTLQRALVADLNGDGHLDLLAVSAESPLRAALVGGDGSGRFSAPLLLDVSFTVLGLAVADVNHDGVYDVGLLGARCEGGSHLLVMTSTPGGP